MNDIQNANLNMFQAVSNVLEMYKGKFSGVSVFTSASTQLVEKIGEIRELDKNRSAKDVKIPSNEKQSAKETLVSRAVTVARIANVYAFDEGNTDLQMQTNVVKSQFYKSQHNVMLHLAKTIYEKVLEYKEPLQAYGLTDELMAQLAQSITAFEALISSPRDLVVERSGETRSLSELFAEVKSLLYDRIDKLMAQYKVSEPQFYEAYFSARKVVNTSYRKQEGESPTPSPEAKG